MTLISGIIALTVQISLPRIQTCQYVKNNFGTIAVIWLLFAMGGTKSFLSRAQRCFDADKRKWRVVHLAMYCEFCYIGKVLYIPAPHRRHWEIGIWATKILSSLPSFPAVIFWLESKSEAYFVEGSGPLSEHSVRPLLEHVGPQLLDRKFGASPVALDKASTY